MSEADIDAVARAIATELLSPAEPYKGPVDPLRPARRVARAALAALAALPRPVPVQDDEERAREAAMEACAETCGGCACKDSGNRGHWSMRCADRIAGARVAFRVLASVRAEATAAERAGVVEPTPEQIMAYNSVWADWPGLDAESVDACRWAALFVAINTPAAIPASETPTAGEERA